MSSPCLSSLYGSRYRCRVTGPGYSPNRVTASVRLSPCFAYLYLSTVTIRCVIDYLYQYALFDSLSITSKLTFYVKNVRKLRHVAPHKCSYVKCSHLRCIAQYKYISPMKTPLLQCNISICWHSWHLDCIYVGMAIVPTSLTGARK